MSPDSVSDRRSLLRDYAMRELTQPNDAQAFLNIIAKAIELNSDTGIGMNRAVFLDLQAVLIGETLRDGEGRGVGPHFVGYDYVSSGSAGFKSELSTFAGGGEDPGQIQHAMAGIMIGFDHLGPIEDYARAREDEEQDLRLYDATIPIGRAFRAGLGTFPAGSVLGPTIPFLHELPQMVMDAICDGTCHLPTPEDLSTDSDSFNMEADAQARANDMEAEAQAADTPAPLLDAKPQPSEPDGGDGQAPTPTSQQLPDGDDSAGAFDMEADAAAQAADMENDAAAADFNMADDISSQQLPDDDGGDGQAPTPTSQQLPDGDDSAGAFDMEADAAAQAADMENDAAAADFNMADDISSQQLPDDDGGDGQAPTPTSQQLPDGDDSAGAFDMEADAAAQAADMENDAAAADFNMADDISSQQLPDDDGGDGQAPTPTSQQLPDGDDSAGAFDMEADAAAQAADMENDAAAADFNMADDIATDGQDASSEAVDVDVDGAV